MKIDKLSSERLSVLRFPLIVGVVFIHAYGTEVYLGSGALRVESVGHWSDFVQNFFYVFIYSGVGRIAVPLFFIMSGYLFFLGFSWSLEAYKKKVKSRTRTLLIPLLFWNCFTLALSALAQSLPATRVYFSGQNALVSTFGLFDYLNTIIGITGSPISYQFWFIRDLMVIVLLTPIVAFAIKVVPRISLAVLFLLWFINLWPVYIPSIEALTFFYLGAYLASSTASLFTLDRFGFAILSTYSAILLIDVLTSPNLLLTSELAKYKDLNLYIHKAGVVFGVASALYLSKFLVKSNKIRKILIWTGTCSFFVFAVHEPWLRTAKKIFYKVFMPHSNVTVLALDLLIPVLVIILSILLYISIKSIAPRFLNVISGGR